MRPCPRCRELVPTIAKIATLEVGDELKVFLIAAALDYEPPTAFRKKRRRRRAELVKLVPHSDPPVAS